MRDGTESRLPFPGADGMLEKSDSVDGDDGDTNEGVD